MKTDARIRKLKALAGRTGVEISVEYRQNRGFPHRGDAVELAHLIAAADQLFTFNALDLRFGYASENGELLMHLLDILFEMRDADALAKPGKSLVTPLEWLVNKSA